MEGWLFFLLVYVESSLRERTAIRPRGRQEGMDKTSLFTVSEALKRGTIWYSSRLASCCMLDGQNSLILHHWVKMNKV